MYTVHIGGNMATPRRRGGSLRRRSAGGRAADQVADGVYRLRLGFVGAYLIDTDDGLVLVDCGEAGRGEAIADAVRSLGRAVGHIGAILVTHHHPDHIGSLADLARRTEADVYVHAADAPFVRGERTWSGLNRATVAGRVLGPVLARLQPDRPEPTRIDHLLDDGDRLAAVGGVQVIHTPGHTTGHVSFLLPRAGGVLIAGDAATNVGRLRSGGHWLAAMVSDDIAAARASFRLLADLEFEIAVFGHGAPLLSGAAERFRTVAGAERRRAAT
jgi:glyoxylase-like metal-dependent hydrolase (beta-lactamase superfamily II)